MASPLVFVYKFENWSIFSIIFVFLDSSFLIVTVSKEEEPAESVFVFIVSILWE